ncbi:MAG TPA: hypothetical protein VGO11_13175 [Chthoniobacteraceae bacterium]|nr:hypothetical protein [Chthoniobacteraceae bacterium]
MFATALLLAGCESETPSGHRANHAAAAPSASPQELPAVNLSIPADWKPHSREWTRVYGAAANGDVDEARRRLARGEGSVDDIRYGWADYLYQQQRIKMWTPIVLAAGVLAVDSMLHHSAPSPDEQAQAKAESDRQREIVIDSRRRADQAAERRGEPKPYGY